MGHYPIFFLVVLLSGSLASLIKGPIWGLVVYVYVYFNIPKAHWWGNQLPDLRWSFLVVGVLLVSCLLHRDKLLAISWSKNLTGKWLLSLLALMMFIAPFSPDPGHSWEKVYDFFRYVLIVFVVGKVITSFRQYKIFIGILLYCTFYLTVLAGHYFRGGRLDGVGLPDGRDANMLAAWLVLVIPLLVVIVITERNWQRWAALGTIPFVLNTFVMCGSRGAFVGFAMQGVVGFWLLRERAGLIKTITCFALVAVALFALMDDKYRNRITGLNQALHEESRVEASAGRWAIWGYGLEMGRDYPLGAGGGAFMALSPHYIPESLLTTGSIRAAHNTWLTMLVEQGIIGLVLFIGFVRAQFKTLTQTRRHIFDQPAECVDADMHKIVWHTYALQISLAGFWTAAFFIDRVYFEGIYLVIAAGSGLYLLNLSANEQKIIPIKTGEVEN